MKAARFHRPGDPLRIEEVPDPVIQPGAAINYKWMLDRQITMLGSSWYPRTGNPEMIGMIASGALDINVLRARKFSLAEVNEAVLWAARGPGGLEHAALIP